MRSATFRLYRMYVTSVLLAAMILVLSGTAAATYAGKNGRVAFVSNLSGTYQLHTMNSDGTDRQQITNLPPTDFTIWNPDFSPDGRQIVFVHDQTGHLELYEINADGTGLVQVTNDGLDKLFPRWSPDGRQLVFLQADADLGTGRIVTMRSDGTGPRNILTPEIPWDCYQPEFSPDGRFIVFASQSGGLISALWIMRADGSNKHRITAAGIEAGGPDYSPDGRRIVFYSQQNTPRLSSIYKVRPDGSQLRYLEGPNGLYPTYSPDGKQILFSGGPTVIDSVNLYTMNADGSNVQTIATDLIVGGCGGGNCLTPDWGASPE